MASRTTVSPEAILQPFDPEIVALSGHLRSFVLETVPDMNEAGYPGWRAVAFRHPRAGYVCGLFPFEDHVRFLFEQGVHLNDSAGILEGATKQTRHITLRPGGEIPIEPLRDLILQAVAFGEARSAGRKRA